MDYRLTKYPIALVLLWLIFVALPIGNRGLWAPDEPRYLQVAWEMSQARAYVIPILNGELYAHKPPLFFWLTIILSKLFSFETTSRWLSALAGLGTVLLTYSLGKHSGDKRMAFAASLILMTCTLYAVLMTTGNIDTVLTFLTTLSFYCFIRWEAEKRSKFLYLTYVACGLAILVKGPVGLLIPWITYLIWEILKHYWWKERLHPHLIWGPVLSLAIAAVWLIPACIIGGNEYTRLILFKQNVGRAINSFAHVRPWYYFLLHFPLDSLPWFIAFMGAIFDLKKEIRKEKSALLFYVLWFCAVFIFFSLLSGKRGRYLLPCYPAFSLVLASIIKRWADRGETSLSIRISGILILLVGTSLVIFPLTVPFLQDTFPLLNVFHGWAGNWRLKAAYLLCVPFGVILWKTFDQLRKNQNLSACNLIACAFLVLSGIVHIYYVPIIDPVKSAKLASEKIQNILPSGGTIAFHDRRYDNGWNFYLKKAKIPVTTLEEPDLVKQRFDIIISRAKYMDRIEELMRLYNYEIATIDRVGSKKFVVLKSKALAAKACLAE